MWVINLEVLISKVLQCTILRSDFRVLHYHHHGAKVEHGFSFKENLSWTSQISTLTPSNHLSNGSHPQLSGRRHCTLILAARLQCNIFWQTISVISVITTPSPFNWISHRAHQLNMPILLSAMFSHWIISSMSAYGRARSFQNRVILPSIT